MLFRSAGDVAAADAVLEAAYESGCAIRISRTTAAHAMSYQITKRLGYAHGHACMLTLPHLWARLHDSGAAQETLTALADAMGISVAQGPVLLRGLLAVTGLLPVAMPDEDTLDALAASVNVQRLGNHPEVLTAPELRQIYVQAFAPVDAAELAAVLEAWRTYEA